MIEIHFNEFQPFSELPSHVLHIFKIINLFFIQYFTFNKVFYQSSEWQKKES